MAEIKQFPEIVNDLEKCAGCHKPLTGNYAIVELPMQPGIIKSIGLCEKCDEEAEATGIFG